jgi:hypothetical protein
MAITLLSTPPTRQDPENFSPRADVFLSELPVFAEEANELAEELNALASSMTASVGASATAAAGSATNAANSATAAAGSAASVLTSVSTLLGLTLTTVTATSVTATAGKLYILTNAGVTTVTLPASPATGDIVGVAVANGLTTNIVARNGNTIRGVADNVVINRVDVAPYFYYDGSTWRIFT